MSKFKMKTKPKKPERLSHTKNLKVGDGNTLQQIIDAAAAVGATPNDVTYKIESDWSWTEHSFTYNVLEDETNYQKCLAAYEVKLAAWNTWYEIHRTHIEAVEAEKAAKVKTQKDAQKAKDKAWLESEKGRIEKQLKKLG